MTLTRARVIQYIGILVALGLIAAGYWYFAARAGVKTGTSVSQPQGTGRLDSGLIGYWALDEGSGTSAADSSVNGNTGTLTNGPTWTTGQIGGALDFDGTDDYISKSDTAILDFGDTDNFTITGWFNRDTATTDDVIVAKRSTLLAASQGYIVYLDATSDKLVFEVSDGTDEYSLSSTATFTTTGWNHFAIVWDQDDAEKSEIYANGATNNATDSGTIGNIGDLSNALSFGVGVNSLANNPFDGKLDEIRLYDRALSSDEVAQLYRLTTPTGVDTSLVGYWSFNDGDMNGTTAYDRSGARNTGTLTNGPTRVQGRIGQAVNVDGSDDYVNMGSQSSLDDITNKTVCSWVYPESGGSYTTVVAKYGSSGGWDFFLQNKTSGAAILYYQTFASGTKWWSTGGPTVAFDTWSHICVTYSNSSASNDPIIYFNGQAVIFGETGTGGTGSVVSEAAVSLTAGAYDDGALQEPIDGSIDEVRIYNRILSASEIAALYAASAPDKTNTSATQSQGTGHLDSGLVRYWKLDDGSGTSAADASVNGSAATLTNGPTWTTGQIGGGVNFDGTDDYISTSVNLSYTPKVSVSFWLNASSYVADDVAINFGPDMATIGGFTIIPSRSAGVCNAGQTWVQLYGNDGQTGKCYPRASSGVWHHYTAVFDRSRPENDEVQFYIDGVFAGPLVTNSNESTDNFGNLTLYLMQSGGNTAYQAGSVDEVRLYDRALAPEEIAALYRLTAPTPVDTSLRGYWSFNGQDMSSTKAYDRSGAGNIGTLTNGPTQTLGRLGQALSFDGSDDYVTVPDSNSLDITGTLTLSAWIKKTADTPTNGWDDILTKGHTSGVPANYWMQIIDISGQEYLDFYFYTSDSQEIRSRTPLSWGVWHHVAVTYNDAANSITLYIDGVASDDIVKYGTPESQSLTTNTQPLRIGYTYSGQQFPGSIDEVRVYSRVLSASEIKAQYAAGAPDKVNTSVSQSQGTGRLDAGLSAYFPLDENTGTAANDASANAITALTLTNGPTWTTGQIGSAVNFDGTDDYATTADTPTLDFADTEDFTLTGWFKRDSGTTDDTILAKSNGQAGTDTGYTVYLDDSTDKLTAVFNDGADQYKLESTTTFLGTGGSWSHFAIVWDQDSAANTEIYLDGAANNATDTGTIGNIGDLSNSVAFRLGAESDTGNPLAGKLDEIRLYDRALSAEEIANLYRLITPTSVDTGLKGYWSFNAQDMSSTTAYDRSGARNDTTRYGTTTPAPGKLGQAMYFNGTDSSVEISDASAPSLDFGTGDFSYCAWIKTTATSGGPIGKGTWGYDSWGSHMISSGAARFEIKVENPPGTGVSADSAKINDNTWHHVCAVYDRDGQLSAYTDGILSGSADISSLASFDIGNTSAFKLGYNGGPGYFQGLIDEVRIYSRVLSASEVAALYKAGR